VPVPNVQQVTPDAGQGSCPKHVELCTKINLEISASVGFIEKENKQYFEYKSILNKSIHPCKSVNHTANILTIYLL